MARYVNSSLKYQNQILRKERILKAGIGNNGYVNVILFKNGKKKTFSVHRLVAIMFIPNTENKPEVNHKWGIKTDNRASELEWNTTSENMQHAHKIGLQTISNKQKEQCRELGKNRAKKVIQHDLQGKFVKQWNSAREIQRQLSINYRHISACCLGKRKTAGGFIWKFKDTE